MNDNATDPRVRRTRNALIDAGRKLFSERPVDAVTIDDIVRAAGVGKGSFYNHFPDRSSLCEEIADEIRARVENAVTRANLYVEDPASRLARGVCTYARFVLDDHERARVLARVHTGHQALGAPINKGLVEDLRAGLARGRFRIPTLEAGALFVLGTAQAGFLRLLGEPSPVIAVTLAQQLCDLLLRGLGLPEAEATLIAAQASDDVVRAGACAVGDGDQDTLGEDTPS